MTYVPKAIIILLVFFISLSTISFASNEVLVPINDVCEDAIELIPNAGGLFADNFATLIDGPVPSCGDPDIKDVWFSFVFTGEQTTIILQALSLPGVRLAIYDVCGGTEIYCQSGFDVIFHELDCTEFTIDQTYFVQVGSFFDQTGSFQIQMQTGFTMSGCTDNSACNYFPNANCDDGSCLYYDACGVCDGTGIIGGCTDDTAFNYNPGADCENGTCLYIEGADLCFNAPILSENNPVDFNNSFSDFNGPDPSCGGTGIQDVWFSFIHTGGNTTILVGSQSLDNPRMAVYDGCDEFGEEIDCIDEPVDLNGDGMFATELIFPCTSLILGHTYYIQVGGHQNEIGDFTIGLNRSDAIGCIDPTYSNFDPLAECDDGSCEGLLGCTDPSFCNYDANATIDNGHCSLLAGCTHDLACNYNALADCDNGSCTFPGCTDPNALNFQPFAGCDDGSCLIPDGCTESQACNYDPAAIVNDGSCEYSTCSGCTYSDAPEFNPLATIDDGSCTHLPAEECQGDFNGDNEIDTSDLLGFLAVFGSTCNP